MAKAKADPMMAHAREVFEGSKLTLDELGRRMGYEGEVARKAAWQFIHPTNDPRLSMLRRFAAAVGVSLVELFADEEK